MSGTTFFVFLMIAYILGSIPAAVIVCKYLNLPDPRTAGSKNPGTTNVLRVGNKKAALLVLMIDVLKGTLPVFLASLFHLHFLALSLIGLAAILGHMFSIFNRFNGGKGVATSFGVIFALSLQTGIAMLIVWLAIIAITRYVSLASMIAIAVAPAYIVLFGNFEQAHAYYGLVFICFAVIGRHYENIGRLFNGEESKLGQKKTTGNQAVNDDKPSA